ncbi:hypothetical protein MALU111345_21205 [Marinicrinis lubricantis]
MQFTKQAMPNMRFNLCLNFWHLKNRYTQKKWILKILKGLLPGNSLHGWKKSAAAA